MIDKKNCTEKCCGKCCSPKHYGGSSSSAVYGIGIIGAAFYYFPHITNLTGFFLAVGKSLVWPAMLVYQALSLLKL
ncbi:MAG: hypothetical protein UX38_C0002G0009 [Microgenomates group bacterium GW2011_GWC1_46_16]|jgi:hypothetical protein|uniref:Uncharacterized protein n=1 Tax=Candidatus Collierbacteria bacterium RIFOXYA2_FULL_46_10 TaxID=1817726 RepID=A0A1F5F7J2_9BACT|nr:MAG: hypothetical protein UX32_C0001G0111 [Microgenomates group bacterium GW2011_GWF1_46_12]KKU26829.1 MAG: hypothetical protein UX38_C0002G0009 [Microgenomates group bacterium GW2011_GWC1_46_16]KKU28245.1 MAG: hypothetical protein UX40_C0001G0008 [Microgenomates group bacterium GW2011_GWF2_46_18]KKU45252.1 MAG: hypothetical protein UX63_C0009G0016 [Microgenomates group bacterium GW2011_GWB1_46_7]KKU60355.1 MAG: hypothetical protein UX84_C0029G0005 [Microgenomates group bacterium GW2011_GWD1